jgi:hypothetical protein
MKRISFFILILLFCFSSAIAGEREVLKALEKVGAAARNRLSYKLFCELLADADAEIMFLRRQKGLHKGKDWKKDKFLKSVVPCCIYYEIAKIKWGMLIDYGPDPKIQSEFYENLDKAEEELDKAYNCFYKQQKGGDSG